MSDVGIYLYDMLMLMLMLNRYYRCWKRNGMQC